MDVVYRRMCNPANKHEIVRDALVPFSSVEVRGRIRYVAVNPLLNHYPNIVREATGVAGTRGRSRAACAMSAALYSLVGPIGVMKDVSTILSLALAARARIGPQEQVFCTALGPWAAAAAMLLRRWSRVGPWIYEDRDYEPGFIDSGLRRGWTEWLERTTMRSADEVITIGRRLADLRFRQTGRRPILIPTGATVSFDTGAVAERPPTLIYIGHVARWSGLEQVVEALPAVLRGLPEARLRIVGEGPHEVRRSIQNVAKRHGVSENVEFLGPRPHTEISALLRDAMVGLAIFEPNPLRTYAMPLKVVEYMAAGLPVVATEDTETADVVRQYDCGAVVPLTSDAIAESVLRLLSDEGRWQRASGNALAGSTDFDWSRLMEREWWVIERCIENRERT